jgi:hypothetical protein
VYGLVSGTAAFPNKAFTIGAPSVSARISNSSPAASARRPARIAIRLTRIQNVCGAVQIAVRRDECPDRADVGCVVRNVAFRPFTAIQLMFLYIAISFILELPAGAIVRGRGSL